SLSICKRYVKTPTAFLKNIVFSKKGNKKDFLMLTKHVYDIQLKNRKTPVTCSGVFLFALINPELMPRNILSSLLKRQQGIHLYK
ncbi:hypothetical protein P4607_30220, partial [Priestia megaterium]|uniref:hypothetical protein n=1 Tax=Priestia megaterium TaxID=1404 RepID=UPI002E21C9B1|nr:hypothetical protein [Priestia megaterium]